MKKVLCLVLALMMVFCVLAGCGDKSAEPANPGTNGETNTGNETTSDTAAFKLGGTAPLTGGAAIYGNAVKNGAQIAVDEINAMDDTVKFELNTTLRKLSTLTTT